jgi:hypothetical protein
VKIDRWFKYLLAIVVIAAALAPPLQATDRTSIPLDGTWDIEDSKDAEAVPTTWNHKVPVPGLALSAQPAFPQVDEFDSRQLRAVKTFLSGADEKLGSLNLRSNKRGL